MQQKIKFWIELLKLQTQGTKNNFCKPKEEICEKDVANKFCF
jgi:hypothetical protein